MLIESSSSLIRKKPLLRNVCGILCGNCHYFNSIEAGAGTTNQAVTRMYARFLKNDFQKYRQKYRHFSKCPSCCVFDTS